MKAFQPEMPLAASCFNLALETGIDIDRQLVEQRAALARECAAKEFAAKMQRQLSECPGFIGGDVPQSVESAGRIVVQPSMTLEAVAWLKRRFHVAENLEVDGGNGLCIDIKPRNRKAGGKRQKFMGSRVEQFQLQF